ncbi:uncharacterized protein ACBT44_001822 [Syngnathus typhle]
MSSDIFHHEEKKNLRKSCSQSVSNKASSSDIFSRGRLHLAGATATGCDTRASHKAGTEAPCQCRDVDSCGHTPGHVWDRSRLSSAMSHDRIRKKQGCFLLSCGGFDHCRPGLEQGCQQARR